jgi:Skp family chaperone for outer membrane proteins
MAVVAREEWTDGRLDDLNKKVDNGFKEMREEFRAVRSEMQGEFQAIRAEMKGEFQGVRGEMQGIRDEVAAMNRNLMQLTWGLIGTMLVGFLGTTVAILTQM